MTKPLADKVIQQINQATAAYYRLILLIAPPGGGKTATLQEVHKRTSAPLININLELCRGMLDLTERQRALQLPRLLSQLVNGFPDDVLLLDNMEVLFEVSLKQDPLRLLQGISRNKTVVASWSGSIKNGHMIYAAPDHREYRRYPVSDFLTVAPESAA